MREFNVKSYLQKFVCHHFRIKKNLNSETQRNLRNLKIEKNDDLKDINL